MKKGPAICFTQRRAVEVEAPFSSSSFATTHSQTIPSAPCQGSCGLQVLLVLAVRGVDGGVLVHPGWHVTNFTVGCAFAQRSQRTWPRLQYTYAILPSYVTSLSREVATSHDGNFPLYIPPDDTTTTREPSVCSRASIARVLKRKVPKRRWHANVTSTPSLVRVFSLRRTPALQQRI